MMIHVQKAGQNERLQYQNELWQPLPPAFPSTKNDTGLAVL
jgi:hypothetical protein